MAAPEVRVVNAASLRLAAVRVHTTQRDLPAAIRRGLDQVWPHIVDRSGRNVVLYHPSTPTGLGPEFDIETGVEVPAGFAAKAPLYVMQTPGGRMVTAVHIGPYDKMMDAYRAIDAYVKANGLKTIAPSFEVYGHMGPDPDPAKIRTDIFFPIG